jgi:streptogramin lyase
MKAMSYVLISACFCAAFLRAAHGQPYVIDTIAGSAGHSGTNDGVGSAARFSYPQYLTVDDGGNVFVTDGSHSIRRLTAGASGWTVQTIAGTPPYSGRADGTNNGAQFASPRGITADHNGNVFVADYANERICKLTQVGSNWVVTTIYTNAGPEMLSSMAREFFL